MRTMCMDISLALEHDAIQDDLSDTPALRQPVVVVGPVVDASIEPGDGRFLGGRIKGGERARGLGRNQAMIGEQGVGERDHAEQVSEDRGGCARLGRVAGGI